jgi:hypothetical protein
MLHSETSVFAHEWATLQNNYEQYEKGSLLIKLSSVVLFVSCMALALDIAASVAVMLILWVQEAIFRTSQARVGERILRVEQLLTQAAPPLARACQLHTEWQAARPGAGGLLADYAKNMLRPTVAFPYVVLVLMNIGWFVLC